MPVKFKPDQKTYNRQTGKTTIERFYIRNVEKQELFDTINNKNTKPKLRQKCINELTRRGVQIEWVNE
jgi:hypothetical protein